MVNYTLWNQSGTQVAYKWHAGGTFMKPIFSILLTLFLVVDGAFITWVNTNNIFTIIGIATLEWGVYRLVVFDLKGNKRSTR